MAKGHDDVYDVRSMNDGELRELVIELLREERAVDADAVDVLVRAGTVRVRGRLGTDAEIDAVERIILDRLGVDNLENELVVDATVRRTLPEAADDAAAAEASEAYDGRSGVERTASEAAHLMDDVEGELYGTEDMARAIERGETYTPPDSPRRDSR